MMRRTEDMRILHKGHIMWVAILLFLLIPSAVSAVDETGRTDHPQLMNGVAESTVYVTGSNGDNVRVHLLRIAHDAEVSLKVSTAQYYRSGSTAESRKKDAGHWTKKKWGYATVDQMAERYVGAADTAGTVIAATNGDFYLKERNGKTDGKLIMEGNEVNPSTEEPFFAVLKSGNCTIRNGTGRTADVEEAVGGKQWLVKKGQIRKTRDTGWQTVMGIGITAGGDIVIADVDGRDPSSCGMTVSDLAVMMKQQGCRSAIQLDGGGSASFLTRRPDEGGGLEFRNTLSDGDGIPRPVSSALLVVADGENDSDGMDAGTDKTEYPRSMKNSRTRLTRDPAGNYRYYIGGKKRFGFQTVNGEHYLFNSKGKGWTKTVTIGAAKYSYRKGKLSGCSDRRAGRVSIGYCGATNHGTNLLYAYQEGNGKLNIGLNPLIRRNSGRMRDWTDVNHVPWRTKLYQTRRVTIGKGVKNIGSQFLRISRAPFNQNLEGVPSKLTSLSLPASLSRIGKYALFNHARLKQVTLPKKVTRIEAYALAYTRYTVCTFKSRKPPAFGKNAFKRSSSAKKCTWKVPHTKKWKLFAASKSRRKSVGFSGTIKYLR